MQSDIKLDNDTVIVEGRVIGAKATDFMLDNPNRRKNNTPFRRALVHDVNDQLTINYGGDYPGGLLIQGNVKIVNDLTVDGQFSGKVSVLQGAALFNPKESIIFCLAQDIMLSNKSAEEGATGFALSHMHGDKLVINRDNGFKGGVNVEGNVTVSDALLIGSPFEGMRINKENIKLRTQKTPPDNGEADKPQRRSPENDKRIISSIGVVSQEILVEEMKVSKRPVLEKVSETPFNILDNLPKVYELDLVEQLYELRAEINGLKKEIAELKAEA